MAGSFTIIDYGILLATLVISLMIGVYYGLLKKQKTNSELLVGGRSMPIIPTSLSLLATYMSPILVLGYAGEIYSYGTLMVETIFVAFIFVPIAALIFMPALYPLKLTSAYEYLENRFESVAVRFIASATFIIQVSLYMGVVLFAPALALNAVVNFPINISIWVIGGCAAVYTAFGGLKAVVWTDVFQMLIMLAGMFAIVIEGTIQAGGLKKVFEIAQEHQRIQYLNFEFNPFRRLTTLNIFFGHGIMILSVCGCQQTTVQRYSSMSSLKKGIWTMMITLPLVAFTVGLAAIAGVVIFANYAGCDPISLGVINRNDQIAPYFVLEYLSPTSGLLGLFIACLFSASMSTVSSGLNSVSAVTWEDFLAKMNIFKKMTENAQSKVTKVVGLLYGLVAIGMAFLAGNFDGVLAASIILNGSVAGPLLGVFLMGVLIPFTNKYGAIVGMLAGHALTIWICIGGGLLGRKSPTLPFSIENCTEEVLMAANKTAVYINTTAFPTQLPEVPWPQKIFTVSFLLYPLIGCTICILFGMLVSLLTGGKNFTKDQEKYIHPLIRKLRRKFRCSRSLESSLELSKSTKSYNVTTTSYTLSNTEINDLNKDTQSKIASSFSHRPYYSQSEKVAPGKKSLHSYDNSGFKDT